MIKLFFKFLDTIGNKKNIKKISYGFTLLEVLIAGAIVVVVSVAGVGLYENYNKNVKINSIVQTIISDLKQAQSKSMNGIDGMKWGVRFVNGDTDYYEIFSTPSVYASATSFSPKNSLPSGIVFSDPSDILINKDIIFSKIVGLPAEEFSISLSSGDVTKTITIALGGAISYGSYNNMILSKSYNITALQSPNGTISPSGVTLVSSGGNQTYSINPSPGYTISALTIDGSYVVPSSSYTFSNVKRSHQISATFNAGSTPSVADPTYASLTGESVTLGANITSLGVPASISARGVCYGVTSNPTNCVPEGGTTTGIFTKAITGLSPGTTYYYRGYATNVTGTAYSADGSFTTTVVPTVTSPTYASLGGTSVTLGANVTSLGIPDTISARGVCYGTSPSPSVNCVAATGTTTGVFTKAITGLTAGTNYYYRGYATNSTGTGYSADGNFTTVVVPTVTSPTYASVTSTTVTLGANVISLGIPASISARGVCYGTSPSPSVNCVAATGTTTGVFTKAITGLTAGTLYYYRGYATNATGNAFSADDTFTTTSSCGGQSINGYCWYANPNQQQNCTTFCSTYSHGSCVGPISMNYTQGTSVCTALWPGTNIAGMTSDPTPRHDGTNYCYLASSPTFPNDAYSHNSCSASQAWQNSGCACTQ